MPRLPLHDRWKTLALGLAIAVALGLQAKAPDLRAAQATCCPGASIPSEPAEV